MAENVAAPADVVAVPEPPLPAAALMLVLPLVPPLTAADGALRLVLVPPAPPLSAALPLVLGAFSESSASAPAAAGVAGAAPALHGEVAVLSVCERAGSLPQP